MTIELYLNQAENNRVDKSAYLQHVMTLEGFLRESSSLIAPVITFELPNGVPSAVIDEDDEDIDTPDGDIEIVGSDILNFNYVYIHEFNRYYFVQDIVINRTKIYIVSLICDTLMSHKDNILALEGLIERNEFEFNSMIDDPVVAFRMGENVEYIKYPNTAEVVSLSADIANKHNFILSVVNDQTTGTTGEINPPAGTLLPSIEGNSFSIAQNTEVFACNRQAISALGREIVSDDTLATFVKSVVAFPCEPIQNYYGTYSGVYLGNTYKGLSTNGCKLSNSLLSPYIEVARFMFPQLSSFEEVPPYRHYELFIPFSGYVELDPRIVSGHELSVYYAPNFEDGTADAVIFDLTENHILYSAPCQLGVKLAFNSTNNREISDQRNALVLNTVVGSLASVLSLGVGVATGNPIAIAGGAIAMGTTVSNAVNQNAMLYQKGQCGFSSGVSQLYSPMEVFVRIRSKRRLMNDLDAYRHAYGSPLQQTRTLSSLTGFTIVSQIHIENMPAYKREREEIERLLKSGVIL